MPDTAALKATALESIEARRSWILAVSQDILDHPEAGFQEERTARLVSQKLTELGVGHQTGIALTGIKGRLEGGHPGPCVAVMGELDSLRVLDHPKADPVTGAAHACGHHAQIGMMLGAAAGLLASGVLPELSGAVALMALPAEEFIDVEYRWNLHREGKLDLMAGKQEFIRLGAFDDVDMAMMVHTSSRAEDRKFAMGGTSNGHVVKFVQFLGRAAHAGGAPHAGVNALNAALIALNAINAQRETFKDQDVIRVHGIMTRGGAAVNSIPADVRYEGRVRGRSTEAIEDANAKVDRCFRAGAMAVGGKVKIVTIPGYLPLLNNPDLLQLFRENATRLVGDDQIVIHPEDRNMGGSTDMGDVSQIMPAVHPYVGGATGTGHGDDYLIQDYDLAVIQPAKAMAMCVIDLLANGAERARQVLARNKPAMRKAEYLALQQRRLREELFEG